MKQKTKPKIVFKSREFAKLLGTEFEKPALILLAHKVEEICDYLSTQTLKEARSVEKPVAIGSITRETYDMHNVGGLHNYETCRFCKAKREGRLL